MEQRPDIVPVKMEPIISCREQPDHVGMINHYPFGLTCRTRGVDYVREMMGLESYLPGYRSVSGESAQRSASVSRSTTGVNPPARTESKAARTGDDRWTSSTTGVLSSSMYSSRSTG